MVIEMKEKVALYFVISTKMCNFVPIIFTLPKTICNYE